MSVMNLLQRRFAPLALAATIAVSAPIATSLVFAQTASAPQNDLRARTQKQVQTLLARAGNSARDLNLSAAQRAKLKQIAQKNAPLAKAIWNDNSLSKSQKMAKMRALKSETSAVLTPTQKEKLMAARGAAMGQLFQTAMWVSNELDLSATQQEKLKNIVMGSMRTARGGQMGAVRSLVLDTDGKINAVLSAAQQKKWSVMKSVAREEIGKNARVLRAAFTP